MAKIKTAIELGKDESRTVYHLAAEEGKEGWAWTHASDKKTRAGGGNPPGSAASVAEAHTRVVCPAVVVDRARPV